MTDLSKIKFQLNDVHKIVIGVVAWCGMYFGLKSDLREYIALQKGVNDVQDLRLEILERNRASARNTVTIEPSHREGVLPKEIQIESE